MRRILGGKGEEGEAEDKEIEKEEKQMLRALYRQRYPLPIFYKGLISGVRMGQRPREGTLTSTQGWINLVTYLKNPTHFDF